jgi:shikimate kinase
LNADRVAALPADQLGLVILNDLIAANEWNEYNYLLEASRTYRHAAAEAIAGAIAEAMALNEVRGGRLTPSCPEWTLS